MAKLCHRAGVALSAQRNDAPLFPLSSITPMTDLHDAEQNDRTLDTLSFYKSIARGLRGPERLRRVRGRPLFGARNNQPL